MNRNTINQQGTVFQFSSEYEEGVAHSEGQFSILRIDNYPKISGYIFLTETLMFLINIEIQLS